jgi:hypothetical protein
MPATPDEKQKAHVPRKPWLREKRAEIVAELYREGCRMFIII